MNPYGPRKVYLNVTKAEYKEIERINQDWRGVEAMRAYLGDEVFRYVVGNTIQLVLLDIDDAGPITMGRVWEHT